MSPLIICEEAAILRHHNHVASRAYSNLINPREFRMMFEASADQVPTVKAEIRVQPNGAVGGSANSTYHNARLGLDLRTIGKGNR